MRLRVLVFAYACEPGTGSESGAGWIWSRMFARFGEAWVVTRANNREVIEAALESVPERARLRFVYVDLPERIRFWKKGSRGARLYYLLWQVAAFRQAQRLHRRHHFDLVWHLTMSTAWLGSLAPLLGTPFAYGPIGGGVAPPWRLSTVLGVRGFSYEVARSIARTLGRYVNPLARISWRRADLILVQNPETRRWLPARYRSRVILFPHIVLDKNPGGAPAEATDHKPGSKKTALYAGRLLPWKGVALALRALALLPEWELVVCGTGPDLPRLKRLARRLGVSTRLKLLGWLPRSELLRLMRDESDVFLFPSLHDEGGWVVVEALANRLPIVCLDQGGPPVLCGRGVRIRDLNRTVADLAAAVQRAKSADVGIELPLLETAAPRLEGLVRDRFMTRAGNRIWKSPHG
jgi:glycosyltransferase involved in cell wall biosynthesis